MATALLSTLQKLTRIETLTEEVFTEGIAGTIDRDKGIIPNVKVLGRESKNGRTYSDSALADAKRLYEGVDVNVNHPPKGMEDVERGMLEGWGILKNTRVENGGVFGDLHFLKEHAETPVLIERIDRGFPIGLSHNAKGRVRVKGNRRIVESLQRVKSVDLVRNPATNRTLRESEEAMQTTTLRELIEATGYKHTSKLLEMLPAEIVPDAAVAEPEVEQADPIAAVKEVLAGEAAKIIIDDSIPVNETKKQVVEIIAAIEVVKSKIAPGTKPEENADPSTETETETATESVRNQISKLTEQISGMQKRDALQSVLAKHSMTKERLGAARYSLLESQDGEQAMETLIATWPPALRGMSIPDVQPQSLMESTATNGAPQKQEEVIGFLRGR